MTKRLDWSRAKPRSRPEFDRLRHFERAADLILDAAGLLDSDRAKKKRLPRKGRSQNKNKSFLGRGAT
jgi:hypothetical protein